MGLEQLTERIYCLPSRQETDQPNLYYVRGDRMSAAIDAGQSERHVKEFYAEIEKAGMLLPAYTLITHWHWDHTFGLPYVQGETIGSALTKEKLNAVKLWAWTDEAMREREETGQDIPFCSECIRKEYPDLSKIRVISVKKGISSSQTLDLGGVHLILYPMDSPHSRDAMMIYAPEERVLFSGDAGCEDHYDNQGKFDPEKLRAYIAFLRSLDFDGLFEGHERMETKESMLAYFAGLPEASDP